MNLTYSLDCIPLITHPTRITTTSSTLLDYVYTNNVVGQHKSFILVEDVSDHLPVMVCSNLSLPKSEKSTVTLIRDTKNFEVEKFLDKLTEGMELVHSWHEMVCIHGIDGMRWCIHLSHIYTIHLSHIT